MGLGSNEAQSAFWNAAPGQNWVRFQPDLDLFFEPVNALMLDEARPEPGDHVLEIGCGAGGLSRALAQAVAPDGEVLGVDISAPLLARAQKLAGPGERFLQADAQEHRFEAGRADLVVSRFGAMFFADPVAAFANIARGMKAGGRMLLVTWAPVRGNPWFHLPAKAAKARLGATAPSDPEAPGPMAFQDIERVAGLLRAAGWQDVSGARRDVMLRHPEGVPAVQRLNEAIGPVAAAMREKGGSPEDLAAIIADLGREFARYATPRGIEIPAEVNLFKAIAP